jgi:hypothetical protein
VELGGLKSKVTGLRLANFGLGSSAINSRMSILRQCTLEHYLNRQATGLSRSDRPGQVPARKFTDSWSERALVSIAPQVGGECRSPSAGIEKKSRYPNTQVRAIQLVELD